MVVDKSFDIPKSCCVTVQLQYYTKQEIAGPARIEYLNRTYKYALQP